MRKGFLLLLLITATYFGFAQLNISDVDLARMKLEVEIEAEELKQEMLANYHGKAIGVPLYIEFTIDTFRIERLLEKKNAADYTTWGLRVAKDEWAYSYDELLNKYYRKLLFKLDNADEEILKQAQRNWIEFRESEKELIRLLAEEKYSGGGSIQMINISYLSAELTKKRVLEIYEHLREVRD